MGLCLELKVLFLITQNINMDNQPIKYYESLEKWYRDQAKNTSVAPRTLLKGDRLRGTIIPGNMYMFFYDPKGKKTLPYYDRFPMIFPIDKTPDGFIGINLHYLPYVLRAKLMDALYDTVTNAKYDTSTKLGITYKILKGASKFRLFKPTIKRYLNSNVRSRFLYIEPKEWDIALFLPVEPDENNTKPGCPFSFRF